LTFYLILTGMVEGTKGPGPKPPPLPANSQAPGQPSGKPAGLKNPLRSPLLFLPWQNLMKGLWSGKPSVEQKKAERPVSPVAPEIKFAAGKAPEKTRETERKERRSELPEGGNPTLPRAEAVGGQATPVQSIFAAVAAWVPRWFEPVVDVLSLSALREAARQGGMQALARALWYDSQKGRPGAPAASLFIHAVVLALVIWFMVEIGS
jgi:hypothetical protein